MKLHRKDHHKAPAPKSEQPKSEPTRRSSARPPESYLMVHTPLHCKCCGQVAIASQLFASFDKTEGRVHRLSAVFAPAWNVPLREETAPREDVPFCVLCPGDRIHAALTALPKPPDPNEIIGGFGAKVPKINCLEDFLL